MATTNSVTATQQLIDSFNQAGKQPSVTENIQDRFLKLLVTQMKNQDPLNPMDNAQVTTQLAQISTVSGVEKLNQTMTSMSSALLAAQSVQATGLIGHSVLASGNGVLLQNGAAVGGVQLSQPADQVTITVRDSSGAALKTIVMGPQDARLRTFAWDGSTDSGGRATDGAYTIQVNAVQGGKQVNADALGVGQVQSVSLGANELQLNTIGLGAIAFSQIKQIF